MLKKKAQDIMNNVTCDIFSDTVILGAANSLYPLGKVAIPFSFCFKTRSYVTQPGLKPTLLPTITVNSRCSCLQL